MWLVKFEVSLSSRNSLIVSINLYAKHSPKFSLLKQNHDMVQQLQENVSKYKNFHINILNSDYFIYRRNRLIVSIHVEIHLYFT